MTKFLKKTFVKNLLIYFILFSSDLCPFLVVLMSPSGFLIKSMAKIKNTKSHECLLKL